MAQPEDYQSETQLHHDAAKLLKGCSYHFQKTVMRMTHIGSIVSPDSKSSFQNLCSLLTTVETELEFDQAVAMLWEQ